jgi:hypothetical protein
MTSTAAKPREKKNEENLAKMPGPGDTIALRDANATIQERAPIKIKGTGLDVSRLLKALREDVLSSGFFVGRVWVPIPSGFWFDITTEAFKDIRSNKNRPGAFFVTLKQFRAEYATALIRSQRADEAYNADWFAAKLTEALGVRSIKREVHLVADERWREYTRQLRDRPLDESLLASAKKGSGRREKGDWKIVYRVLAAHLIENGIEAITKQTRRKLAEQVLKQAYQLNDGKMDAPATDALEDEIRYLVGYVKGRPKL